MNADANAMILVSPVFNEQEVIHEFLTRVAAVAESAHLRGLVIVDDGSRDKTCEVIADFARMSDRLKIRIVRLSRNFGHQNATLAGLSVAEKWARDLNVPFVALIDADLQDRPEHLQDLLDAMETSDVSYAVRRSRAEGPFFKFAANVFYNVLSKTSNLKVPRYAGTFSVMRTHVVRAILSNSDNLPYLPGLRAWAGFRQRGVSLDRDARYAGDSRVGFRGLFRLAINAVFAYSKSSHRTDRFSRNVYTRDLLCRSLHNHCPSARRPGGGARNCPHYRVDLFLTWRTVNLPSDNSL